VYKSINKNEHVSKISYTLWKHRFCDK
jgi:hypothetical protein